MVKTTKLHENKIIELLGQQSIVCIKSCKLNLTMNLIIAIILSVSTVCAIGVTYPYPQNIELKPGQSSYFAFQIQSDDSPISCIPIVEDSKELELAFSQNYDVEASSKLNVKAQVIAPKTIPTGEQKSIFCIECSPSGTASGSKVVSRICNLPVTVNIVTERTGKNMLENNNYLRIWITFLIAAIVILSLIILFLVVKRFKSARK